MTDDNDDNRMQRIETQKKSIRKQPLIEIKYHIIVPYSVNYAARYSLQNWSVKIYGEEKKQFFICSLFGGFVLFGYCVSSVVVLFHNEKPHSP